MGWTEVTFRAFEARQRTCEVSLPWTMGLRPLDGSETLFQSRTEAKIQKI